MLLWSRLPVKPARSPAGRVYFLCCAQKLRVAHYFIVNVTFLVLHKKYAFVYSIEKYQ
jgi:hypothetical protein